MALFEQHLLILCFLISDNLDPHNNRKRHNQHKNDQDGAPQVKRDPKKATDDFYFDKFRNKFRKH